MNNPEIDEAQLVAEATAAADAAPVTDVVPDAMQAQPVESWTPWITAAMPTVRGMILPQWDLQDQECEAFAESLGQCLDMAIPGAFAGKYACWANLVLVSLGVAGMRMMKNGGKLPPLGPKLMTVTKESNDKPPTEVSP